MNKKIRFKEWAELWLQMKSGMVKSNTFEAIYRNSIENHLIPEFGDEYIDEIIPIKLQLYINREAIKYSTDTIKKFKSCLFQLFDEAVWNGYCEKNPCSKLKIPKKQYAVQRMESGERFIIDTELHAIAKVFGISINELLEEAK